MAERDLFDHKPGGAGRGSVKRTGALRCDEWEALLTEAEDGLLPAAERAAFDAHATACAVCGELLEEARQGREWLRFLEAEPEVPAGMVERIVSRTSGAVGRGGPLALGAGPIPAGAHVLRLPVRRVMWDSRMLMTAAMAFFSIALTLNLAGARLSNLRLSDLTPASLEMNLTRQFYGAKGSLVRYYDNLRLVYEVESKVRDLRRSEQTQPAAPKPRAVPANPSGNGHKNGSRLGPSKAPEQGPRGVQGQVPLDGAFSAGPEMASAGARVWGEMSSYEMTVEKEAGVEVVVFGEQDQAEGGLA